MAMELGITTSAYSKIETGKTDPSVGRIQQIAKILEVDPAYFLQMDTGDPKIEDHSKNYGFATKADIEEISGVIRGIQQEIAQLKAGFPTPAPLKKKK